MMIFLFSFLLLSSWYIYFCYFHLVQEDRISESGKEAENRESALFAHACFLIKSMSQREEHIRDIAVNLLTQLRDRFPQVELAHSFFKWWFVDTLCSL